MGGKVFNGHAVNARRAFVPFTRFRQVVAGQYVFKQFFIHFDFVLFQGSVRVDRRPHLTRSGLIDLVEVFTSVPCVSLFGPSVPPVLVDDVAANFFDTWRAARHGAWVLVSQWNRSGYLPSLRKARHSGGVLHQKKILITDEIAVYLTLFI